MQPTLIDSLGRRANYLRLSLTEDCNLSCFYCKTDEKPCAATATGEPVLTIDEITRLAVAACDLGITKIRLTGGEPTLRADLVPIVARLAALDRIHSIAMTTNGLALPQLALPLRKAGLNTLNVSLDSLDPHRFAQITRSAHSPAMILAGIDAALEAGFARVSINVVLLADLSLEEREAFFDLARKRPLSIRFIELMRTEANTASFARHHLGAQAIATLLAGRGFVQETRPDDAGPARLFRHADYCGSIGIISPYLAKFCGSCNRLRIDSRGRLHPCLFGNQCHPLREFLASDAAGERLRQEMALAITVKPAGHKLDQSDTVAAPGFSKLGG